MSEERETQELPARWWDAEDHYHCACGRRWKTRCLRALSAAHEPCPECKEINRPVFVLAVGSDAERGLV